LIIYIKDQTSFFCQKHETFLFSNLSSRGERGSTGKERGERGSTGKERGERGSTGKERG